MPVSVTSAAEQLKQNSTELAVLQVHFQNIDEKVDDLKQDLRDLRELINNQLNDTQDLVKSAQIENTTAIKALTVTVASLEKWKWMLMGAALLSGFTTGMGPTILKLIGIH